MGATQPDPDSPVPVGLVIGHLHYGGAERQLYELAVRLPDQGYEPVVVTLSEENDPFGPALIEAGIRVESLKRRMHFDPYRILGLRRIFRRTGVRLVHSYLHVGNAYSFAALAGIRTVPLVSSVRSCGMERHFTLKAIDRFVLKRSRMVIANSRAVSKFVHQEYDISPGKIRVIHNGIDCRRFQSSRYDGRPEKEALGIPPGALVIGGIGRLSFEKGFDRFLGLARRMLSKNREVRFVIAGEGSQRLDLEREIGNLRMKGFVYLLDPRRDVERLLSAIDILLQTSFNEGLPNVVLEAMAMEIPCVVTDAGGSSEAVADGVTGFVLPVGDDEGQFQALLTLAGQPETRRLMGKRGRKRVETMFSLDSMVDRTALVYRDVLQR